MDGAVMAGSRSIAFEDLRRKSIQRKASSIADESVEGKVGSKIGDFVAGIFAANSLTGIGVLTVPYAFQQAGWLLGVVTLLVCMLMAYITGTYIIEAEAIVNAIHYADSVGTLAEDLLPRLKSECEAKDANPDEAVHLFQKASVKGNSTSAFKIRDRVEVGAIGEKLLVHSKLSSKLIYLSIVLFIYGSLSAFVVTVNTSLANTIATGWGRYGPESAAQLDPDHLYPFCLVASFVLAFLLCLGDLQKTKKFTVMVMIIRFIAMSIMFVAAMQALARAEEAAHMDFSTAAEDLKTWDASGLGAIFGNSVYVFTLHHALPSMIAPLEHQGEAPQVLFCSFTVVVMLMVLLSVTAMLAFGEDVRSFYNLNFAHMSWFFGIVGLFIVAYPTFAISTIPTNAITLRNTLQRLLHAPPTDPDQPLTFWNLLLTALVLLPPFTVAFITRDIQVLIKCVGGYFGLTVSYALPLVLVIFGRRRLVEIVEKSNFDWGALKSPFGNTFMYMIVASFYLLALIRQMFFS
mmetsp:Transcript_59780/g.142282  ORF Transcript_59780/g.142282 Transcript_59780/m.142282 type:complete len:517 (+) Transcript_59780:127-1677(+)|eukprot:CAMPEP_0178438772 /NCGR_PEP_ID=MMETSP0689_2-20121128/35779_1 /TAXON_ID=160604 /ORGANISM="Amphidinium massartii, Strain CS-259" /LENGTH=516 /DNA_ID=CAMNT_0020061213 /DNA_START=30 /DNA_END=1580 /DNA_ORIENTATION=-